MQHHQHNHKCGGNLHTEALKDPVCGMNVAPVSAKGKSEYQGQSYLFCSVKCKAKFDQNPGQYLVPKEPNPQDGAEYTCPMHPEIRKIGPGSCPICGMALEPVTASTEAEDTSEYRMMLKRFSVCALLSVPLLFVTMGGRHLLQETLLAQLKWVELILVRDPWDVAETASKHDQRKNFLSGRAWHL